MGISISTATSGYAQSGGNDVTRNAILQFLTAEKPSLFSSFLVISQAQITKGVYNIDLLTQYGTYFARVVNNGLLYLSSISVTSSNLCSDLSPSEYTANTAVASISSYIAASYPSLSGYTLQLVQGFMNGPYINYRFLYSQAANRYEFLLGYSSSMGKYLITKATKTTASSCDNASVLVASQCVRSCQSFAF